MNKQMNLPALSNIMREFDRQNERMEMTSEMMGDAVDDAFEVCNALRAPCSSDNTFGRRCPCFFVAVGQVYGYGTASF